MKLNTTTFLISLIIILLGLLALEKWSNRDKKAVVEKHYEYQTDTIWAKEYYKLKTLYDKKTPPKTITRWLKPEPGKEITIEVLPDSLILRIEGLKQELVIAKDYISNFPLADKLIDFDLTIDSLNITTLGVLGDFITADYPLYLDNYNYQWYDNTLHNSKYNKPKVKKRLDFSQLYMNTKYDYFNKYNTLGLDYSLKLGRFKVLADYNMILQPAPNQFRLDLGIGYKLLK